MCGCPALEKRDKKHKRDDRVKKYGRNKIDKTERNKTQQAKLRKDKNLKKPI